MYLTLHQASHHPLGCRPLRHFELLFALTTRFCFCLTLAGGGTRKVAEARSRRLLAAVCFWTSKTEELARWDAPQTGGLANQGLLLRGQVLKARQ